MCKSCSLNIKRANWAHWWHTPWRHTHKYVINVSCANENFFSSFFSLLLFGLPLLYSFWFCNYFHIFRGKNSLNYALRLFILYTCMYMSQWHRFSFIILILTYTPISHFHVEHKLNIIPYIPHILHRVLGLTTSLANGRKLIEKEKQTKVLNVDIFQHFPSNSSWKNCSGSENKFLCFFTSFCSFSKHPSIELDARVFFFRCACAHPPIHPLWTTMAA